MLNSQAGDLAQWLSQDPSLIPSMHMETHPSSHSRHAFGAQTYMYIYTKHSDTQTNKNNLKIKNKIKKTSQIL